jgi:hypothetical protein
MGTSTILDIIGSMIIGGFLLTAGLKLNSNAYKNNFLSQENVTVQQNLTALIQYLEHDFRKMGYRRGGNWDPDSIILYARKDSLVFLGDMSNDGVMDTVTWYFHDSTKFTPALRTRWHCPNPNVGLLIRKDFQGSAYEHTDTLVFGVTLFSFSYYNTFKIPITDTPYVFPTSFPPPVLMQVNMMVQPVVAYDTSYSQNFAFWTETRLVSRNLTAR